MRKVGWIVFGMTLLLAACSGNASAPATAPPTSAVVATVTPTTTPDPTTTSTIEPTTTTVDRVAEIEAILLDLVTRSLRAQFDRDEEAFRSVFSNSGFEERSMQAFDEDLFGSMPTDIAVEVVDVVYDGGACIAALQMITVDGQVGNDGIALTMVLERRDSGEWGISFNGEGWACEGPHPFGDS